MNRLLFLFQVIFFTVGLKAQPSKQNQIQTGIKTVERVSKSQFNSRMVDYSQNSGINTSTTNRIILGADTTEFLGNAYFNNRHIIIEDKGSGFPNSAIDFNVYQGGSYGLRFRSVSPLLPPTPSYGQNSIGGIRWIRNQAYPAGIDTLLGGLGMHLGGAGDDSHMYLFDLASNSSWPTYNTLVTGERGGLPFIRWQVFSDAPGNPLKANMLVGNPGLHIPNFPRYSFGNAHNTFLGDTTVINEELQYTSLPTATDGNFIVGLNSSNFSRKFLLGSNLYNLNGVLQPGRLGIEDDTLFQDRILFLNDGSFPAYSFKLLDTSLAQGRNSPALTIEARMNGNSGSTAFLVKEFHGVSQSGIYYPISGFAPDMTSGEQVRFSFGKSDSPNNRGFIGFNYMGTGSAENFMDLGFQGLANLLNIRADGKITIGTGTAFNRYKLQVNGTIYSNDTIFSSVLNTGTGNDFVIGNNGKISRYANQLPANGKLMIGNSTTGRFELGSLSSANGSISINENEGNINLETSKVLADGEYMPVLTNTLNIEASTAYITQYLRVGNRVTVSGKVEIDPTITGNTELRMGLPFTPVFQNDFSASGSAVCSITSEHAAISSVPATGFVAIKYAAVNTVNNTFYFSFTYKY